MYDIAQLIPVSKALHVPHCALFPTHILQIFADHVRFNLQVCSPCRSYALLYSGPVSRKEPKYLLRLHLWVKMHGCAIGFGEGTLCGTPLYKPSINQSIISITAASQQCRHGLFTVSLGNAHARHRDFHDHHCEISIYQDAQCAHWGSLACLSLSLSFLAAAQLLVHHAL